MLDFMNLESALCNLQTAQELRIFYSANNNKQNFVDVLITASQADETQIQATWLIKHHLQNKCNCTARQADEIIFTLGDVSHWEARLHILQSIPYLEISAKCALYLNEILEVLIEDKHGFVRAWAYNAVYVLSNEYPEYKSKSEQKIRWAILNETAAVRARLRNLPEYANSGK